jgi:hypothetical protein
MMARPQAGQHVDADDWLTQIAGGSRGEIAQLVLAPSLLGDVGQAHEA